MYDLISSEALNAPSSPACTRQAAARQRADLVQRQEQFETLAMPIAGALYAAALCWSGNHAQAEDLVQETLLRAWLNFDHFTLGTSFKAWAFQILRFVVCNLRKSAASRMVTMDFEALESLHGIKPQAEEHVEPFGTDWESVLPDLVDDALKQALACLSPTQRTVALCIALGGLSYRECADELGIPLGTVMSRYCRARTRLHPELLRNGVSSMRCRSPKLR